VIDSGFTYAEVSVPSNYGNFDKLWLILFGDGETERDVKV